MDYKIEQALLRLNRHVEKQQKQTLVQFKNDILRINDNRSEFWWTFIYFIFLIITPLVFLIHNILFERDYFIITLLILITATLLFQLKKIIVGGTTLEINLKEQYFTVENNHILFKKMFGRKKISFHEVAKSKLSKKHISHKYSSDSQWLRLSIKDTRGKNHILTDFGIDYSDSIIAKEVKILIDAIILKKNE